MTSLYFCFQLTLFTFSTDDRVVGAGDSLGRVKLRFLTTSDEQDAKLEEDFIAEIFHPVIVRTLGQNTENDLFLLRV